MTSGASDTQEACKNKEKTKHPVTQDELKCCFDSLATAAVTGKDQIEAIVKFDATPTKTDADLSALVKSQAAKIKLLSNE